jgi:hypothetical protein
MATDERTPERRRLFAEQLQRAPKDVAAWPGWLRRAFTAPTPSRTTVTEGTIWLRIGEGVDVEIGREAAMAMSERDFARFYCNVVWGASRGEARSWARRQVAERSAASKAVAGSPDGEEKT